MLRSIKPFEAVWKTLTQQAWLLSPHSSEGLECDWPFNESWEHGSQNVLYITVGLRIFWCTPGAMDRAVPVCQGYCAQISTLTTCSWFHYWGPEFVSWMVASRTGCAYETSPPWKPQTLTLKWVFPGHASLSFAAREKAHPVQPWTQLSPDLPGLPDAYLLPAASVLYVLFIVTNFIH